MEAGNGSGRLVVRRFGWGGEDWQTVTDGPVAGLSGLTQTSAVITAVHWDSGIGRGGKWLGSKIGSTGGF